MFNLHCTKKLLARIKPQLNAPQASVSKLGSWYATVLFWKPQMILLVNERTLLPVLMPLSPIATFSHRFPGALAEVLKALDIPSSFIQSEIQVMGEAVCAKTANRSVVGVMKEFAFLAEGYRNVSTTPLEISLKLASTPCGPLFKGPVFPDKAILELAIAGSIH